MSVALPVDVLGGDGSGVEGEVDDGGRDGGATTGAGGCNKFAIAEFRSRFDADREPLDEGAEPLPAEAAARTPAAPANGIVEFGGTMAEPVEGVLGRGAAVALMTGAVAVGVVPLVLAVGCVACPAATPDVSAAWSILEEVAGAVVEAMAGRLVNARWCVIGTVAGVAEVLDGPIGPVMRAG